MNIKRHFAIYIFKARAYNMPKETCQNFPIKIQEIIIILCKHNKFYHKRKEIIRIN